MISKYGANVNNDNKEQNPEIIQSTGTSASLPAGSSPVTTQFPNSAEAARRGYDVAKQSPSCLPEKEQGRK